MAATTGKRRAVVSLPSDTQVLITRVFDSPRHVVFRAWTTPGLIAKWWHANRGEVTSIDVDLRPGGRWRYVMRAHEGFEVAFHGMYREVVPNEQIICTEVFEGVPEAEAVTTTTFAEADGRTTVSILVEHKNKQFRDMHVESGMEDGLQDALDLLAGVAADLT